MDNLINSAVTTTIGLTDQQVVNKLLANPNMNDAQIAQFMQSSGVSPSQMSRVSGIPEGKISARVAATIPPGNTVTLGDTVIAPQYRTTGSGMDEQIGALEGFAMSKSNGDINYKAPAGTPVQIYSGDGEFVNTVKTKKDLSFFGGIKEMLKDPVVQAAILGVAGGAGVFDGVFAGTGAAGTGAGSAFELANAGAGAFEGANAASSLASMTPAQLSAFEAMNAGAGAFEGGTALNSLAGTGAGSAFEAANAGASANTIGGTTVANAANTANAATAAGTTTAAANAAKAGVLGLTTADALALQAGGTLLGAAVNKNAINDVSDIINQAGTTGQKTLADVYQNQKDINTANRIDLGNINTNLNTNLNNTLNAQSGIYNLTNQNLYNNYANLNTNLNNTINAQVGQYDRANKGIRTNAQTQLSLLGETYQGQKDQAAANANALNANYGQTRGDLYDIYNKQVAFQQPYQAVGRAGSKGLLENQDYFTKQFGTADLNTELAPNYAFMLGQGQMANQRAANMGGGSVGGNALQGLQKYTQDYAGNAYQQAFNNFQGQRQNIYSTLAGMANIGTTSAGQLANLGNALGGNLGSLSNTLGSNLTSNTGNLLNAGNVYGTNTSSVTNNLNNVLSSNLNALQGAYNQYGSNLTGASNTYGGNMINNSNQLQNAYNQYGGNLTNAANNYGSNLTTGASNLMNAGNIYGSNATGLTVGLAGANSTNTLAGANLYGTALNNLANTAFMSSLIKAT